MLCLSYVHMVQKALWKVYIYAYFVSVSLWRRQTLYEPMFDHENEYRQVSDIRRTIVGK